MLVDLTGMGVRRGPRSRLATAWPGGKRLRILLALLLGSALAACGPAVREPGGQQTSLGATATPGGAAQPSGSENAGAGVAPRVALLVPLTGANAEIGKAMQNAAALAVQDVADNKFVLLPRDTKGTPEGAKAAAEQVLADGATLILGPLLSANVKAIEPLAREKQVNIISFSSDKTVAGDGAFVMGFLPGDQVRRIIGFAASKGRLKIAVLAPDTPYGRLVADVARAAAADAGATLVKTAFYDATAADLSATVRVFAEYKQRTKRQRKEGTGLDFDAVLLPEGGVRLLQVAPLLPFFDVDPDKVMFLGTGQWDSPIVYREPNLIGGYFAAPPPTARTAFMAEYKAAFGGEPPRLATLAYDATALAAMLAKAPTGVDFSVAKLTAQDGFSGADGIFRFRADGTAERGLAVIRIEKNAFTIVDPSRQTFQTATN